MAHMHYKGTGKIHSFRGLLEDGGQDEINIEGSVGAIAWRITKFALIGKTPGSMTIEGVVKVYREEQTTVDGNVNFEDNELLAAGYYVDNTSAGNPGYETIIFDNSLFSRNIWVTGFDASVGETINYYIELEEVKVSAAGKAQLALAAARRTGDR